MCAITASFSIEKLKELYKLNAYRGELSYSLTTFDNDDTGRTHVGVLLQDEGKLPDLVLDTFIDQPGRFYVAHSQAPTTDTKNIHPAAYGDALLWHNGIIKQKTLSSDTWDTAWLLENIIDYGWSSLSRVDGTFACIMYWGGELFVFRNEISPLFVDSKLNFSSTKFEGSQSLDPNRVWKINLESGFLDTVAYFETFENPYYIPENA